MSAQDMVPTGLPGGLERFVAYAKSAAIAMAGYGANRQLLRGSRDQPQPFTRGLATGLVVA